MALLDGYHFGDRLLEGVMFEISITEDEQLSAKVCADCADYMKNLNMTRFLVQAVDCAKGQDVFECPGCGGEAIMLSPF